MIYQVRINYGNDIAYFSFQEDSITQYRPESIRIENGQYISDEQGEIYSFFPNNISSSSYPSYYWGEFTLKIPYSDSSGYIILSNDLVLRGTSLYVNDEVYKAILSFYDERNKKRRIEKESIQKLITNEELMIAENLILSYVDDELFNYRILFHLNQYSSEIINPDWKRYYLLKESPSNLKGKEKKEFEEREKHLKDKLNIFLEYYFNFSEMVAESKTVNIYVAYAIAWESIRQKSVMIYSRQWEEIYSDFLNENYDEIHKKHSDSEKTNYEYIKKVLTCEDIFFSEARGRLIYYLISKESTDITNIAEYFRKYDIVIKDIQKEIKNDEIKNKLRVKQLKKPVKYTIDDIDLMSGKEFEEFVSILFQVIGYKTKITQATGDQGIDVIAVKNGIKLGIQAKCYTNAVGNSAVQEVVAGKGFYSCDKVMVITNNYYTSSAIELAQANNVVLWDRDFLKMKISEIFN